MPITAAFTYAFQDKRWPQKLGVLVLLGCIPGLNILAWVGYQQTIAYNIAHRRSVSLPSWDDWADILVRGLIVVSASGLYWLPVGVFALLGLFPALRLFGLIAIVLACVIAFVLCVGHVRYARTDQPRTYTLASWRLAWRNLHASFGSYLIGTVLQALIVAVALFLTPVAFLTLIGPMLIWTAVSVLNGYILGQIAESAPSDQDAVTGLTPVRA